VYLHLESEGIRFKKRGRGDLKSRNKTLMEKKKKCNSAKFRTHVHTIEEPHPRQLSYKASANQEGTAAHKKCRNDGAGSLALGRCQVYAKNYP